ncbi:hypothetical protein D3C85_1064320 [compost metagenome]
MGEYGLDNVYEKSYKMSYKFKNRLIIVDKSYTLRDLSANFVNKVDKSYTFSTCVRTP